MFDQILATILKLFLVHDVIVEMLISFTNLQEFVLGFYRGTYTEDFKKLQYAKFPKLQTLKIPYQCPNPEYVMKFLETNGNNLKNLYTVEKNNALSLSIAKFCPNLRRLFKVLKFGVEKNI
uniref:Uncharacterized protein n=1 Tax=Rhizophagus irregularis (strain DAOM 181602 / DAOM 197198 / MUCL 43194) TaxID=747089 RepID=U9USI6_RHIID